MYKITETYVDFNDVERTEDYYFNLTEAELTELELGINGGLGAMIEKIIQAKDTPSIVKVFKELILKSYGEKSDDGRMFRKSQEIRDCFEQTPAYSNIFMRLSTDDKAAAAFINGIVPKNISEQAAKQNTVAFLENK